MVALVSRQAAVMAAERSAPDARAQQSALAGPWAAADGVVRHPRVDETRPVWFNGRIQPLGAVRLSPLDRGFLFADGVYEVVPIYAGRAFAWAEHYARLERSLAALDLDNPLREHEWLEVLAALWDAVRAHERLQGAVSEHHAVYWQFSRGVAPRDHAFPSDAVPTVFIQMTPMLDPEPLQAEGVSAIALDDARWARCDIKSVSLLPNVIAREMARRAGAAEALLFGADGALREGAASNVFVLREGRLSTPPLDPRLLPGVTRGVVMTLARERASALGIDVVEAPVSRSDVAAAEEIWLTSSTKELVPVVRLDGRPVGRGVPGPVFGDVAAAYRAARNQTSPAARWIRELRGE